VLSDVVAGSPKLLPPFVGEAKYAAELRNHYWQHVRQARGDSSIVTATHRTPYPLKSAQCSDRPAEDTGANFGRIARYGLLDTFVPDTTKLEASGIPIAAWLAFFRLFTDQDRDLDQTIERIGSSLSRYADLPADQRHVLIESFERIASVLRSHAPGAARRRT